MLTPVNTRNLWNILEEVNLSIDVNSKIPDIYLAKIDVLTIIIKYVLEQDLDNAN